MKQNLKKIIQTTGVVLGISISIFFLTFVVLAWTGPQHTPPTCETGEVGCDVPLHTGAMAQTKTGGLLLNTGGATNGLIIENGNVGIGVTDPDAKLHILGPNLEAKCTGSDSSDTIQRIDPLGSDAVLDIGYLSSPAHAWFQSRNKRDFSINYDLSLNPNGGNVGIGTTEPSVDLEVNGEIKADNFLGLLNNNKMCSGLSSFSSGTCNSPSNPCLVNISGCGFSNSPICTITMQNHDGTGYTENMVIKEINSNTLSLWKGNYQNEGTTMRVFWICVGN